jgi:purine-cytosine permease-like protein
MMSSHTKSDEVVRTRKVNEFEREPVPESQQKGWRGFLGMYAGEHAAGTEFMIGPLFLAAGVSAFDLIFGLLLGNVLAMLSWAFICAPLAVKHRLTLYYKLEQICGVRLVTLYNLANGILFCFLAGAMISVSATAVGVPFQMQMPGLGDWMPNSLGWVVAVIAVGAVISVVAALGYNAVAKFGNIASPWMVLIFLACGIVTLPKLGVESIGDFWNIAQTRIWVGGEPMVGQMKFTFWHVVFFAWFCNAAMHFGLADMSVLRYAKKWYHGFASGTGVFVGHYMAWIAASLLYAWQLLRDPSNTSVSPGPMAYEAVGIAGLICVVVAGWTTANPTIYRAGLAFQAVLPRSSRFTVTLIAGAIATIGAIFPALVMQLLGFVGLYGLILMPMGAVIFANAWIFPRLGIVPDAALANDWKWNWAAAAAWGFALAICGVLMFGFGVDVFFLALPGWIICGTAFVIFSKLQQRPVS